MNKLSKRLYSAKPKLWKTAFGGTYLSDKELSVRVVENGIALPARHRAGDTAFGYEGGVCDADLNFVAGHTSGYGRIHFSYDIDRETIEKVDEDVIHGGVVVGHFGHFLTECFIRLWYIAQHPELKCRVLIFVTHRGKHPWHDEFFKLLGMPPERVIYVDKPMQFRSITVPEESLYKKDYYTKEFIYPFRYICSNIQPADIKKIYLSRIIFDKKKVGGFHCFGERYFENFFRSRGYTVIELETLTIQEQIALISGAEEIVAIQGTLSHWALFCKPGTRFIMLNADTVPNIRQDMINEMNNIDWCVVNVSRSFVRANRASGVCLIGITAHWQQFVLDYFGEQISADDDVLYLNDILADYAAYWCRRYAKTKWLAGSLKNLRKRISLLESQTAALNSEENNFAHQIEQWKPKVTKRRKPTELENLIQSLTGMCYFVSALEKLLRLNRPMLYYETHLSTKGWLPKAFENHISGFPGQKFCIEAIKINFSTAERNVFYSVYYPTAGWSEEVSNGAMAGTTGKARPIFGIKIRLDETGGGA